MTAKANRSGLSQQVNHLSVGFSSQQVTSTPVGWANRSPAPPFLIQIRGRRRPARTKVSAALSDRSKEIAPKAVSALGRGVRGEGFPRPPEANLNPHRGGVAPGASASVQTAGADLNPLRPKLQNREFLTPRKEPSHSSSHHPNPLQAPANAEVVDARARPA